LLALLAHQNDKLLARQRTMFKGPKPLWARWLQACDFLDEDLASGYVRVAVTHRGEVARSRNWLTGRTMYSMSSGRWT
jgi:hypothetical protein